MSDITLISVRGWPVDLDPRYPQFIERIRQEGIVVHDVFVPGIDKSSLEEWASAYLAQIDALGVERHERRLLGYCLGGHVLLEVAHQLCTRGEPPCYLGLIDVRDLPPLVQVQRGIYRKYRLPVRRRIRHHARLLSGPYAPPTLRMVARTWARAIRGTLGMWKARRFRRARPDGEYWWEARLAYSATFREITSPAHLYNCAETIDDNLGDLTLGLAPVLRAGFALRTLDGTHLGCVDGEAAEPLVRLVTDDLRAASSPWIDQRSTA